MNDVGVLSCGCEKEFIGGKWLWIYCDEHETEEYIPEVHITKYRKRVMDYES